MSCQRGVRIAWRRPLEVFVKPTCIRNRPASRVVPAQWLHRVWLAIAVPYSRRRPSHVLMLGHLHLSVVEGVPILPVDTRARFATVPQSMAFST